MRVPATGRAAVLQPVSSQGRPRLPCTWAKESPGLPGLLHPVHVLTDLPGGQAISTPGPTTHPHSSKTGWTHGPRSRWGGGLPAGQHFLPSGMTATTWGSPAARGSWGRGVPGLMEGAAESEKPSRGR